MELPQRKPNRIPDYDYSQTGTYFITICTQGRKRILSKICVGTGVLDCPLVQLLPHGEIANKTIRQLGDFYGHISVDQYAIMPDHIHILLPVHNGQSGTPVPTGANKIDNKNSTVSKIVSTFKRFGNKEYGENIWQSRYYDHVIRNQQDYNEIWQYIENYKTNRCDIALVQRLLQHSSATTTQRYIGIEPQRIEHAIKNHAQLI